MDSQLPKTLRAVRSESLRSQGEAMSAPTSGTIKTIGHPLCGRQVVLKRCRMCDDGGWYEIQGVITEQERDFAGSVLPFPVGDSRANRVLLYPEDIHV
jgi:hypothetical protein